MKAEKITIEVDVSIRGLPGDREREVRTFNLTETRFESREDGTRRIVGHAAVFNQWSEDLGGFREQIAPGAFAQALTDDVRALFNHDTNQVLGRNKAGTLTLLEDDRGLLSEIILPDTQLARDLEVLMKRGDINQMSFAFSIDKAGQEWVKKGEDETWERTITQVARLYDVSVVTFPAYPQTDAAVRALNDIKAAAQATARGADNELSLLIARDQGLARLVEKGL